MAIIIIETPTEENLVSMPCYSPLLTDLYQLTMAYGYWQLNMHHQRAAFHLLFRKNPFNGHYALNCGLASVIQFIQDWRFKDSDLAYLATLKNAHQTPLFSKDFLDYLKTLSFTCDIDAIPEGTIVFANTPLLRIEGPLIECQLLETALLNILNFQTLIATKASRVCRAAKGDEVIEFGMRRSQGPDGALSASRAAYIGGCVATSNTLAGQLFDIPVRGTHAHSWVSAFDSEEEAFAAYAKVMPESGTLLVDTYDTLKGVAHAIETGKLLRKKNADLVAIRLDSGNLARLSIEARALLDQHGFKKTQILASNSLDEYIISDLKQQGAKISIWGVGTHLTTAKDQSALDGVYKLSALENKNGEWQYRLKLSEDAIKISNPGRHQVRRFFYNNQYIADVIYDLTLGIADTPDIILLESKLHSKHLSDYDVYVDLLEPIFRNGKLIKHQTSIHLIRSNALDAISFFDQQSQDKPYTVGLEKNLFLLKETLIEKLKKA